MKKQTHLSQLIESIENNSIETCRYPSASQIGWWIRDDDIRRIALALRHNSSVKTLKWNGHQIGADGIKHFASVLSDHDDSSRCCCIQEIHLALNRIGVGGGTRYLARALCRNSSVHTLVLAGNRIDNHGVKQLAWALRQNSSLVHLNLSDNPINDQGVYHLTSALQHNSSLSTLILQQNDSGQQETSYFVSALHRNYSLHTFDRGWTPLSFPLNQLQIYTRNHLRHKLLFFLLSSL